MLKFNSYLLLLMFGGAIYAQSPADIKKITGSYDAAKIENLKARLQEDYSQRQARIQGFLSLNPSFKESFYKGDVKYHIYDVVNGRPLYESTDNALAARALKTNRLYPGGAAGLSLEGEGITVGVWDGGWIRGTHAEFNIGGVSRVTHPDASFPNPESDGHGTHVGGTIGARGASSSAKGMAPKASIKSYEWDNDAFEVVNESVTNGLLISNHSYGTPIYNDNGALNVPGVWYMGCYTNVASQWDDVLFENPYYLAVMSAGNSGNDLYEGGLAPAFDKLTGNKNSKNALIVANANPTVHPVTGNITALTINPSSSQGPTDDGRIKPDIAGDGTNLFSSYSTNDTSYETLSGTSMASPNVAGSIALLQEHYRDNNPTYMKSATVRALVTNTAVDDTDIPGPDPKFGWGLMDALAAANVITKNNSQENLILESSITNGQTITYQFSVSSVSPIRATIAWTDPAGTPKSNALNSPDPALVNNLDLRISQGGDTFLPYLLDLENLFDGAIKADNNVDNIERVDVDEASGTYTLTISHKGTISGGTQDFSLIISGNNIVLGADDHVAGTMGVWPNPAKEVINFRLLNPIGQGTAALYDISGRQVLNQNFRNYSDNNYSLNTSGLSKGVYMLKVTSGAQSFSKKVILE